MVSRLKTVNTGTLDIDITFAPRINLFTGDNGLGKSFLLDVIWWALTRRWPADLNTGLTAGKKALPVDKTKPATIQYSFEAASGIKEASSTYRPQEEFWRIQPGRPANPGFVFYALADGSFAVWDPLRNYWSAQNSDDGAPRPQAYVFSPQQVWDGLQDAGGTWLCNGLIRDWASWQKENGDAFKSLRAVLDEISPSTEEKMRPGSLTRISLSDVRDMPTLQMPYGQDVPVVHTSSGMRRIMALAYFLVWCWDEHKKAALLTGTQPAAKAVFLIDEAESHLHPKWQRTILPSLLDVMRTLTGMDGFEIQLLAVTHSPLIMSSLETRFDGERDKWFDFDLLPSGKVQLVERTFLRHGEIQNWLTSDAFDLKTAYPADAEKVITQAAALMKMESPDAAEVRRLDAELRAVLSETDPLWLRWTYLTQRGRQLS